MTVQAICLLVIIVLVALILSSNNRASRLAAGVLGGGLAIFLIGMLLAPEATRDYSLRIIAALGDVFRAICRAVSR